MYQYFNTVRIDKDFIVTMIRNLLNYMNELAKPIHYSSKMYKHIWKNITK